MKYEDIKIGMNVTNGSIVGVITHIHEIGRHKPIVVGVRSAKKFGTMNFWPAELEVTDAEQ